MTGTSLIPLTSQQAARRAAARCLEQTGVGGGGGPGREEARGVGLVPPPGSGRFGVPRSRRADEAGPARVVGLGGGVGETAGRATGGTAAGSRPRRRVERD